MDLPFLSNIFYFIVSGNSRFNPYSNGSSFFIIEQVLHDLGEKCFNPYSNGSSFFIKATPNKVA